MTHPMLRKYATPLCLAGLLVTVSPLLVAQPSWADGKNTEKHGQKGAHGHDKEDHQRGKKDADRDEKKKKHFGDRERTVMFEYYNESFTSGHCPPGLEKKHNGCMPPGLDKQWVIGRALPRDLAVYDLPPAVVIKLGPPPVGHRYVRVARDILMIAEGTGMVMDALEDLSR